MARFARTKLAFLQRFRRFADGAPSHDPLGACFKFPSSQIMEIGVEFEI